MRGTLTRLTGALVAALLIAGCKLPAAAPEDTGSLTIEEPLPSDDGRNEDAADLLDYYRLTADMAPPTVVGRLGALRGRLEDARCDETRVRTAMLASRLPKGEGGAQLGQGLLEPCVEDPFARYTAAGTIAVLIDDMLAQRAGRHAADAAGAEETERATALASEAERLRAEIADLEKQVEGLKDIERSIQERDRDRDRENGG